MTYTVDEARAVALGFLDVATFVDDLEDPRFFARVLSSMRSVRSSVRPQKNATYFFIMNTTSPTARMHEQQQHVQLHTDTAVLRYSSGRKGNNVSPNHCITFSGRNTMPDRVAAARPSVPTTPAVFRVLEVPDEFPCEFPDEFPDEDLPPLAIFI